MEEKLKPGTRIRFLRELSSGPDEDGPGNLYARKGDLGTICIQADLHELHGTWEGFYVFWEHWDSAAFGCEAKDFEVLPDEPLKTIHYKKRWSWALCGAVGEPITNILDMVTCQKCKEENDVTD